MPKFNHSCPNYTALSAQILQMFPNSIIAAQIITYHLPKFQKCPIQSYLPKLHRVICPNYTNVPKFNHQCPNYNASSAQIKKGPNSFIADQIITCTLPKLQPKCPNSIIFAQIIPRYLPKFHKSAQIHS